MKPWGGRFSTQTAPAMEAFGSSLGEDAHLITHDVIGSLAHVRTLETAGLLTPAEAGALQQGLRDAHARLVAGQAHLKPEYEDVHMNVEVLLKDLAGPVAGKLHTARSRNDQVALDMRLWTREAALALGQALCDLQEALLAQAEANAATPMPGYTHLQPAQPITFGHWCHAHAVRAQRDVERALAAFDRANVSPLGAGALAGTSFPIDPEETARALGMDASFDNSLDAVSDRDFAVEAVFAASLAAVHLSGLAEELVLWSSPAYGFVSLPEAYTTGSSIMPQKRNADSAELSRGRAGAAVADLHALLVTLKGLPLAYNRDLQEAKAPLLRALPAVTQTARVLSAVVKDLAVHADRMSAALRHGHPEATELADYMTARGVPFREAHHVVGTLVKTADAEGLQLSAFPLSRLRAAWPGFAEDVFEVLDPARVPERKITKGGTAPERVRDAVELAHADLKLARSALEERAQKVSLAHALLAA